jgi:hypothetical protein
MNENFKHLLSSLDLGGMARREEIRKQDQQSEAEQYRRSFEPAFPGQQRVIDLRKLAERDPALVFFLTQNRDPKSA